MSWKKEFFSYILKHPLLFLRFNQGESYSILESRHSTNQFSFTRKHNEFGNLKVPAPCIFFIEEYEDLSLYIGIARSKRAVSTIDSAVKITDALNIKPNSPEELGQIIENQRFKTLYKQRSGNATNVMSPKLSIALIDCLLSLNNNRRSIEIIGNKIINFTTFNYPAKLQMDAVRLAMLSFQIGKNEVPTLVQTTQNSDSTLRYLSNQRVYEDNVIIHDARSIPGYKLIKSDLTGRAVFKRGNEQLEVITANRTVLEKVFGIDLIYINYNRKNMVMVQYKMLKEKESQMNTDWIFRPNKQFFDEKKRMVKISIEAQKNEYRLNDNPYYFKFVNKFQKNGNPEGFLLPLDHLNVLLEDPAFKGSKGGTRISYNVLEGRYLRESDFLGLIRSGYCYAAN